MKSTSFHALVHSLSVNTLGFHCIHVVGSSDVINNSNHQAMIFLTGLSWFDQLKPPVIHMFPL